jgi:hypothetical protein
VAATRFCSSDGRSFTDLLTNVVVFRDLNFDSLIKIMRSEIPPRLLPDLLHEFTHHWCMFSPVGVSLSALHLRSRQRLFTGTTQRDFVPDIIRYESITALIRPLAEALALFAEFDVQPGPGHYRCMLFPWVLTIAGKGILFETKDLAEVDRYLTNLLKEVRSSEEVAARKENLFGRPLNPSDGGYLPGYLALKRLWNDRRGWWHDDAELFFGFVRSVFFDDFGMVCAMLDPTVEIEDIQSSIAAAIRERIDFLHDPAVRPAIERFHDSARSGRLKPPLPNDEPLFGDRAQAARGGQLREELIDEVTESSDPRVPQEIQLFNSWILAQRERICMLSVAADVRVNEHKRCIATHNGNPIFAGPARPDARPQSGEGTIQMFFSAAEHFYVTLVTVNGDCVASMFSGSKDETASALRRDYLRAVQDRTKLLELRDTEEENFEVFLRKQPTYAGVEAFRELATYEVSGVYLAHWALRGVPRQKAERIARDADSFGVYALLERDTPLMRALVAAGLGRDTGHSADQLEEIVRISTRVGVPLATRREGELHVI